MLGLGLNLAPGNPVLLVRGTTIAGGTSSRRYSFASTRLRLPTRTLSLNTATYPSGCSQAIMWSPDYDVTDPVFVFPLFYDAGDGDVLMSGGTVTVRSVLVSINGASAWTEVPGASFAGMATLDGSSAAWLTPAFAGLTIPANSQVVVRVYYTFSGAGVLLPSSSAVLNIANSASSYERFAGITTANDGATGAAWTARATGAPTSAPPSVSSGQGSFWAPIAMLGKGGDGRPTYLGIGPSGTMHGQDDTVAPRGWSNRGCFGAIERGLDDNVTVVGGTATKRLAMCNFGVNGSTFMDASGNSYMTGSRYAQKRATLQLIHDTLGDWPFDKVVVEPFQNNIPATNDLALTGLTNVLTDIKSLWGKPIVYNEGTVSGALDASGNYSITTGPYLYPSGVVWYARGLISNVTESDPTAYFRANGTIEESFAQYRGSAGGTDTAGMNSTIAPSGYTATLTADVTANNQTTLSLDNPPQIGMALLYKATDGTWAGMIVTNVSGTTYTVAQGAKPALAGTSVREGYGTGSIHPSPRTHALLQTPEVVKYKKRSGYV